MTKQTQKILRIDASARLNGSTTRTLLDRFVSALGDAVEVTTRDLARDPLPQVSETWIGANFTPEEDRSADQQEVLAQSDKLIDELEAADTLIIGLPIYNFGVPAALKAWVDLVARARKTFRYTENGPEGLLTGKRAIIVAASGGTGVESDIDFATPYLKFALGFIGIKDVTVISAGQQMVRGEEAVHEAEKAVDDEAARMVSALSAAA